MDNLERGADSMNDAEKTVFLTKVGMLYLKDKRGYRIAPEVKVWRRNPLNKLDAHRIIDLLGVCKKWIPEEKRVEGERGYKSPNVDVLRGIEIKVSRSDFKNGFIQDGCNYHYLMYPKDLLHRNEIPKHVGAVSVDIDGFEWSKRGNKYRLDGVETLRSPRFQEIPERDFFYATRELAEACTNQMVRWARDDLPQRPRLIYSQRGG